MTLAKIDIYDRRAYADGAPHELFTELRRTDPVHWQEVPGQAGYWALMRHADVDAASRDSATFSSELGGIMVEDLDEEALGQLREMLLAMDAPRHLEHRRPLAPHFTKRVMAGLEDRVRLRCREVLAHVPVGVPVEVVHDLCAPLPSRIVGELLGLPREDWDRLHLLAEAIARTVAGDADDSGQGAMTELAVYGIEHAAGRRGQPPREDLTTVLLESDFGDRRLDDIGFAMMFVQLFTAANDTTVGMLSGGLLALLEHPDQLALLRSDPSLTAGAVEEVLRYANPLHYFRRTATRDVELRGKLIRAGDKVALHYTSANRDEDVFADPHRFDVLRGSNSHLAFGIGQHFCLGVHLARLEGRVFFEELLSTFSSIELAGPPTRLESNFNNGLDRLPVVLRH